MNMLERTTTKLNIKKPKVKWQTPDFFEDYFKVLKQVFGWIVIVTGFIVGAVTPIVPVVYLLVRSAQIPPRPVHNGWWIFLLDVFVGIFWYTAYFMLCKRFNEAYEQAKRNRRNGW